MSTIHVVVPYETLMPPLIHVAKGYTDLKLTILLVFVRNKSANLLTNHVYQPNTNISMNKSAID